MLEIDGEFFKDPFEERQREKMLALAKLACEIPLIVLNNIDNPIVMEVLLEVNKAQIGAVKYQPLFPSYSIGGVVCSPPETVSDVLTEAIKGEIKMYKNIGIVLPRFTTGGIVNVHHEISK